MAYEDLDIVALTAEIVAAHVANNSVSINDIPTVISSVHSALVKLAMPEDPASVELRPAVSIRASVKPEHLLSMIDGRPYKMLKRHLAQNGYTPQSYREAFKLPADYPMTAPNYAAQRSELARKFGLGRNRQAGDGSIGAADMPDSPAQAEQQADA